jgi:hypothetical protein
MSMSTRPAFLTLVLCGLAGPLMGDSVLTVQDRMLLPSDGRAGEQFGSSCSASEDTLVIGSYRDADNGVSAGGLYTYVRDQSGRWMPSVNLVAWDGADNDLFGLFLDIEGDTLVVGAIGDSDRGTSSGSVYVFDRPDGVGWIPSAKLTASDGAAGDSFGGSLALSGRTILAGAFLDDDLGSDSGSVYVFNGDPAGEWHQSGKLTASDGSAGDHFGLFMDASDTTAVIGAPNAGGRGAAYVFERFPDGSWLETARLSGDMVPEGAEFGGAVAISGDTIAIGAPGDDRAGVGAGSLHLYQRGTDGAWRSERTLTASDAAAHAGFGRSVVLEDDAMVVGAPFDDANGSGSGSGYLFSRNAGGVWMEATKFLASDGRPDDMFASFMPAITGDTVVIGARYADHNGADSGAAYLFDLERIEHIADIASPDGIGLPDGRVDGDDLVVLFSYWGGCEPNCTPGTCSGDLNGDCIVDGRDLELLLGQWSDGG